MSTGGAGFKIGVVGESGAGKGTYIKSLIKKYAKLTIKCLSTRNDWGFPIYYDFYALMDDCMGEQASNGSYPHQVKNHIIIIDEAQVWLPKDSRKLNTDRYKKFMMLLANSRACNNVIIFVMHGFSQMPTWLPLYIQGIERFFTRDNFEIETRRFPQFPPLTESFQKFPVMKLHDRKYIKLR